MSEGLKEKRQVFLKAFCDVKELYMENRFPDVQLLNNLTPLL